MVEAYPLQYPKNWDRSQRKEFARFKTSFATARYKVINEVRQLGGKNIVISSNIPLKNDGLPYANFKEPEDTGVAVYFILKGSEVCIPCDKWKKCVDNLHAISLCISALRGLDRWGAKNMVEASFRGFTALPSPDMIMTTATDYFGECTNVEQVNNKYKNLAKELHPDINKSENANNEFAEMKRQYEVAQTRNKYTPSFS
jgi:hypothetical protein